MKRIAALLLLLTGCATVEPLTLPDGSLDPDAEADVYVPPCECDEVTSCCDGCYAKNEGGSCFDGNPHTVGDTCEAGTCVGGPVCLVTYYRDKDGDGYGDPDDSVEACGGAPEGYVDNAGDCYDDNALANPDQTGFFGSTMHRGDGSFDYNCDGVEELERTKIRDCTAATGNQWGWSVTCLNWYGGVCQQWTEAPGCGESRAWYATTCANGGVVTFQGCR